MLRTPDQLLNAQGLADYLGVSRQTIYNQLHRGLPSIKIGAARRFRLADVDAWLNSQQVDAVLGGDAA